VNTEEGNELRKTILTNLVNFGQDITMLKGELAKLPWDSKDELVVLRKSHLVNVITRFLNGQLSGEDVTEWANAIELREDIAIEPGSENLVKDIIFDLANPEINYKLDSIRARRYLETLDK
jgi:hypothetical protein